MILYSLWLRNPNANAKTCAMNSMLLLNLILFSFEYKIYIIIIKVN